MVTSARFGIGKAGPAPSDAGAAVGSPAGGRAATDPASVLPPSAWAVREIRAYVPSHYEVCMGTSPPKDVSDLLSLLPARAADLLRDRSRTRSEDDVVSKRRSGAGAHGGDRPIGHVLLQAGDRGGP